MSDNQVLAPLDEPASKTCRICHQNARPTSWDSLECAGCGCVIVKKVPTNLELQEFYQSYNERYSGGGGSGGRNQSRYAQKYLSIVKSKVRVGTLIDIGCANNPFPNYAATAGFSTTAVDFTKPDILQNEVNFETGHLNDPGMLDRQEQFDVITAWAVLEHVRDPDMAFAIIRSLAKPDSWIFITTPEIGTSLTNSSAGRTPWFYPPEHLNLLSPQAIEILANRHGLRLERWGHFEISSLRFLARYGIGLIETVAGGFFKCAFPSYWKHLRDHRLQKFRGIALYVLKPVSPHPTPN